MNGEQLKQLREQQGWSQAKLADLLNPALDRKYGSATISRWETGKAPIPAAVGTFLNDLELAPTIPDEHLSYEEPGPDFPFAGGDEGDTPPPPPSAGAGGESAAFSLPTTSSAYARVCEELFELIATGVGLVGAVTGSETLQQDGVIILADKRELGRAWAKVAETNETFRNMLTGMHGGGAWLNVALVSGITVGKVMRNHQGPRTIAPQPDPEPGEEGVTMHGDSGAVVHFPAPAG